MRPASMSRGSILAAIQTLQEVQMCTPPDAPEWIAASELLQPLFEEMARRERGAA